MQKPAFFSRLIADLGYEDYLEIGLGEQQAGEFNTFSRVRCKRAYGVDSALHFKPHADAWPNLYYMKSDEFFKNHAEDKMFDMVFIDGNHKGDQVMQDFFNSNNHLKPGGCIIMHDVGPPVPNYASGDAYIAWMRLRNQGTFSANENIPFHFQSYQFKDSDDVVGIVCGGKSNQPSTPYPLTKKSFLDKREEILNLKYSYEEVLSILQENKK